MSSALWDPNSFALDSHTRDEIALFLAKAALAAGPAVMEEYDRGCEVSFENRRQSGYIRGSSG